MTLTPVPSPAFTPCPVERRFAGEGDQRRRRGQIPLFRQQAGCDNMMHRGGVEDSPVKAPWKELMDIYLRPTDRGAILPGRRSSPPNRVWITLAGLWLLAAPGLVRAQFFPPPPGIDESVQGRRKRLSAFDGRLETLMRQATDSLQSNPARALEALQLIFEYDRDSPLDEDESGNGILSLQDSAEELLRQAPGDLLQQYERRYGPAAQALLQDAFEQGRRNALLTVARHYALTNAGIEAMWRLAVAAADSGDPRTARHWLQRIKRDDRGVHLEPRLSLLHAWSLVRTGDGAGASRMLLRMRADNPNGIVINNRTLSWFQSDDSAVRWLSDLLPTEVGAGALAGQTGWEMIHGDLRRNARSPSAQPVLDNAWSYPLIDQYDDQRHGPAPDNIQLTAGILQELDGRLATSTPLLPVAEPLLAGDSVIFAGLGSLKSVSRATGQFEWTIVPVDETLGTLFVTTDPRAVERRPELIRQFAMQRVFRDHVTCSISTDGRYVYRIGHSGMVGYGPFPFQNAFAAQSEDPLLPRNYNYLQAYEIAADGRLKWVKGGPPRRLDPAADPQIAINDLAGAFFLGAPIPWHEELLCLIEHGNQVALASIDPADESVSWLQPLLDTGQPIASSIDRRFAGISAAIDGSTLVAATGRGTIAAFDVAARRWMWSHVYKEPDPLAMERLIMRRLPPRMMSEQSAESLVNVSQWHDPRTLVAGSRVLATPTDSDALICLELETGRMLWQQPRDWAMFLACATDDCAIVVGRTEVRALSLEDGSQRWSRRISPPSGRGVHVGRTYTLPLSTFEMLTIDLEEGQILARTAVPSGRPVGNLVSAPGMLITQTASEVRAFRTDASVDAELTSQLAAKPQDPALLRIRGELRLHRGDTEAGEADLQAAADTGDSAARRALAWCLANGLDRDFDQYSPKFDKIDALSDDPDLLTQAWQCYSAGLDRRGDPVGALSALARAAEFLDVDSNRLLDRAGSLRVRERGLLLGKTTDLWNNLPDEGRRLAVDALSSRLGSHPETAPEIERMIGAIPFEAVPPSLLFSRIEAGRVPQIEAENRLLKLRENPDPVVAARACLLLAKIGLSDARFALPESVLNDLTGRLGSTVIEGERTAAELLAGMLALPENAARVETLRWPNSPQQAEDVSDATGIRDHTTTLVVAGRMSELLDGWVFAHDANSSSLVAYDAMGVFRWQESIPIRAPGPMEIRLSACGRLLLVESSENFRILDAYTGQAIQTFNMFDTQQDVFGGRIMIPRQTIPRSPQARLVSQLTNRFVAYMEGSRLRMSTTDDGDARLVVKEIVSGRELWSRPIKNVMEVLADDDLVCAINIKSEMHTFRAADGKPLPVAKFPEGWGLDRDFRVGVRRVLIKPSKTDFTVGSFNPALRDFDWKQTFPADSQYALVEGSRIGVLTPHGELSIFDVVTGTKTLHTQLDGIPLPVAFAVSSDASRLFVATSRRLRSGPGSTFPRDGGGRVAVTGRLYALDRNTGNVLWSNDVQGRNFDLRQPGLWPFLVLSGAQTARTNAPGGKPDVKAGPSILLLDRADGHIVHEAPRPNTPESRRGWKCDPKAGVIAIRNGEGSIQINFHPTAPSQKASSNPEGVPEQPAEPEVGPPPPPESVPLTP